MISVCNIKNKFICATICLIFLLIIPACSARPSQSAVPATLGFDLSSDGMETPEATLGFDLSKDEDEPPQGSCPNEKALYNMFYSHEAVLDIIAPDGETFYLEFNNMDFAPTFFQFWINPTGELSTEEIVNIVTIGYKGTANHPGDKNCPVQTFNGAWEMKAEISGRCKNGKVNLHIKEEWIDPEYHSSCGDAIGPGPGLYSGPELDLEFDLSVANPMDGLVSPEGGQFYANYSYTISRFDFIVPTPSGSD